MSFLNSSEHFARHGGVHYQTNVNKEQINLYVRSLPENRRQSMYQVMKELEAAGMITVINDGVLTDGEGKIGGNDDC